jgi:hypothetical protein
MFLASPNIVTPSAAFKIEFPIGNDATKYMTLPFREVKGMRQEFIKAVDAIEPYQGGKGHQLWVLHKLNNTDKHRLLLTVGAAFKNINTSSFALLEMQKVFHSGFIQAPGPVSLFTPVDRKYPLKTGDVLFTGAPGTEVKENMDFGFEVALGESQVAEGEPLLETLQHFADLVDNVLAQIAPLV